MAYDRFYFLTLGDNAPHERIGPTVVLDTNVVSALESLAVRGFDSTIDGHRAARSLLEWGQSIGGMRVDTTLDGMEGASYHRGTVDAYGALRRLIAVEALLKMSPAELETFFAGGEPVEAKATLGLATRASERLDLVEDMMTDEFLPAYAVSLVVQRWYRWNRPSLLHQDLVDLAVEVGFLPDAARVAGLLLEFGNDELVARLRDGLFKVRDADVRKSALSAAWDLTYLARLQTTSEEAREVGAVDVPAIVTADSSFAALICATGLAPENGRLALREFAVPEKNWTALRVANYALDAATDSHTDPDELLRELPTRYRAFILQLESDLAIEETAIGDVRGTQSPSIDLVAVRGLLEVLLDEWGPIVQRLYALSHEHDVLLAFSLYAGLMMQQAARVRQESVEECVARLYGRSTDTPRFIEDGRVLVISLAVNNQMMSTAIFKSMFIHDNWQYAMLGIIETLREVIEDISATQDEPATDVVRTLIANIDHAGTSIA